LTTATTAIFLLKRQRNQRALEIRQSLVVAGGSSLYGAFDADEL